MSFDAHTLLARFVTGEHGPDGLQGTIAAAKALLAQRVTVFALDAEQTQKLQAWDDALPDEYTGAVGGRLSFTFVPTSIGTFVTVHDCITQTELDLSQV